VLSRVLAAYCPLSNQYFKTDRDDYAPTIAAQMIGSVGVKQAEIAKHETKLKIGKSACKSP